MMQKEVINKSGVFPYVQMEKEVYFTFLSAIGYF